MKKKITILFLLISVKIFSQKFELITSKNSDLITNDLWNIAIDKNGNKYIGTTDFGLIKLDIENEFTNLSSEIKDNYVTPIFSDSKGNIWLKYSQSFAEIAMYDGHKWNIFNTDQIPTSYISAIDFAEDTKGNIYFGGSNGLFKYNGTSWQEILIPEKVIIRSIDINENEDIALGHNKGILIFSNGKWISLTKENSQLQLSVVREVKYINDKLFIGYGGGYGPGGLSILHNGKWKHYNKNNSKLPDHTVSEIEVDSKGVIWLGTNDGLVKMKNNRLKPIFFRKGKYQNTMMDIAIDKNDNIWIATTIGVVKLKQ